MTDMMWPRIFWPPSTSCGKGAGSKGLFVATVPAAFWATADGATWSILPLQILLVNAWIPIERFVFGFNPPAWTISVECFFYVIYPALIFRWTATWQWKLAGSALLMLALALIGYAAALPAATTAEQQNQISTLALLYGNPLARLFEFTLGMTAAMVWHRAHNHLQFSFGIATALETALLCAIVGDLYWTGHKATAWATEIGRPGFATARRSALLASPSSLCCLHLR